MGKQKLYYLRTGKNLWEMHPNTKHFMMCHVEQFPLSRNGVGKKHNCVFSEDSKWYPAVFL